VRLSRAASASSAVPVVLSPVTMNNLRRHVQTDASGMGEVVHRQPDPPRPAARAIRSLMLRKRSATASTGPIFISSTAASPTTSACAPCSIRWKSSKRCTRPACRRRWTAREDRRFVVNSLSSPPTNWDKSEVAPGTVDILLKSAGTPIDAFSFEAVELLKDTPRIGKRCGSIRNSAAFAANKDPAVTNASARAGR
jgi:NTE family protein